MIYYIINTFGLLIISYFQYKKISLIKEIMNNEGKKLYRYYQGTWKNLNRDGDYKWKVFLILEKEIISTDKKMSKFLIKDVISERIKDNMSDFELYKNEFYKSTGGGWLNSKDADLLEYEELSMVDKRIKKLEQLGIK